MAYLVLVLALTGGLILASTFVFEVNDAIVTLGWAAWLASLTLLFVATVVGARRDGSSMGDSVRYGARQAWEWLKAFTP